MDSELEQAKQRSVGQLLFKAARLWNEAAVAAVRALGEERLRVAHTAVFPHLDLDGGTRLTELAKRMGVSKQAAGQLVDDLVEMGMVARTADPADKRAIRVVYTPRGIEGLKHGLGVLGAMETALAARIGPDQMAALHEGLTRLLDALEGEQAA